jgi:hypothetical protein
MNTEALLAAAFVVVVITSGVVAIALIALRAQRSKGLGSAELGALNDRLARIEQAIDAMAVETERISEGQRFTTKLLSEKSPARIQEER